ncbi:(3R)-3-hydroxyacyl-CoA dehydrogenase isoform X3 [Sphaerodactylus townsendi]|uniref:(3R)-3-hydroxyacyl-CoA dehydrogenase isoform X3 n=1 Tax=Sphaerodactylus townsendi TaxID=933632 RepID=UPI002026334C|nr:(3R)-3-hydroxyacyl-CoA dehydrogenase isoform X3 [Sphaerodactylus townsendi]
MGGGGDTQAKDPAVPVPCPPPEDLGYREGCLARLAFLCRLCGCAFGGGPFSPPLPQPWLPLCACGGLWRWSQTHYSRPATICVNCAGITTDEFLLKQTEEAFDAVLRVNLKGTFLVTQAVAQALVASGAPGGSIINMGSIVGKVGNLGQVNYAASKAGVEALTKTAAKELARYGIRCNTVLPGFVRSPMTDKVPQKVLDKFAAMVPLGRLGEPEDVADVCAFLASDESRYITGASVEVTGGLFI